VSVDDGSDGVGSDADESDADEGIFLDSVRSAGDLALIYEWDGRTGYCYLCRAEPLKILAAVEVQHAKPDEGELEILWTDDERYVGFWERDELRIVYDCATHACYGGRTPISDDLRAAFGERVQLFTTN
jgi:hypothetical protein